MQNCAAAPHGPNSQPIRVPPPARYAKKSQSDDRMKGRQFISQYPKRGLGGAAEKACYFDRQFPSLFIGEKYVDRTMYLNATPDTRKNGFGSSDAKRRQFNDVEVNKWRERIKNEMEFVSRFASQHAGDEEEAAPMEKDGRTGRSSRSTSARRRRAA